MFDDIGVKRTSVSDSFGRLHEKIAREAIDRNTRAGIAFLECVQGKFFNECNLPFNSKQYAANIILTWYYYRHAR